jgi:hypothetical protein
LPLPCRTVICSYSKSRSFTRNRSASDTRSPASYVSFRTASIATERFLAWVR